MRPVQLKKFSLISVVMVLFNLACLHDPAMQKRVLEQDRELKSMQKKQDYLENKMGEMDLRISALAQKVARSNRDQPPPLDVVRMAPAQAVTEHKAELDEYAPGAADDGSPPVVIKLRGRRHNPANKGTKSAVNVQAGVKKMYTEARSYYTRGQFDKAAGLFQQIVQQHPKHDFADNSAYWQGMCAYEQGRYTEAIELLQKIAVKYPGSAKIPDAFFSIAQAYQALGDKVSARVFYLQLVQKYPQAEARGQAEKALKELD